MRCKGAKINTPSVVVCASLCVEWRLCPHSHWLFGPLSHQVNFSTFFFFFSHPLLVFQRRHPGVGVIFRVWRRHSLFGATQTLSVTSPCLRQTAYLLSACSALLCCCCLFVFLFFFLLLPNTEAVTYSGRKKGRKKKVQTPPSTFPDNRHSFSPAVGQFSTHHFLNYNE